MENLKFIIVGDSTRANTLTKTNLTEIGHTNIKVAFNGGHALAYLDQLHLENKLQDQKIVILLHMNTPIVDGLDFLKKFSFRQFPKENILIIGINDGLADSIMNIAEKTGVECFLTFPVSMTSLTYVIDRYAWNSKKEKQDDAFVQVPVYFRS
ncbi:MAG TPA: hypothetical protein VIK89_02485 [Cytophagaceae bacterium]